jgi:hypothetical protein
MPADHKENSPRTQHMPEVFPVVTHAFRAPPFQKHSKLETLNQKLEVLASCARCLRDIQGECTSIGPIFSSL